LGALVLIAAAMGAIVGLAAAYLKDLPGLDTLEEYRPSLVTTLYADDDQPFASLFEQRRILIPLGQIPAHLKQALLAVEDAQFYGHRGVNPRAILRAAWANLRALHTVEGASTITQQLARVLFLTPDRKFTRKLKEALLALQIERRYPKDKILELYMNQIYLGHGAYGFEAAAQTYFGKSVRDLTLAEAAMLAGLPSGPTKYSPILDPERARRRRDHVLSRMRRVGIITPAQFAQATREPVDVARAGRGPYRQDPGLPPPPERGRRPAVSELSESRGGQHRRRHREPGAPHRPGGTGGPLSGRGALRSAGVDASEEPGRCIHRGHAHQG
jgi:penicillin-binding protein 1A